MIEESYVSFDTAKLLKEAGFNVPICKHYTRSEATWTTAVPEIIDDSKDCTWFPCPTQALAARWLREVHYFAVCIWFSKDHEKWFYAYGDMQNITFDTDYNISGYEYETYEAALESGLQNALKLIIKKPNNEENNVL